MESSWPGGARFGDGLKKRGCAARETGAIRGQVQHKAGTQKWISRRNDTGAQLLATRSKNAPLNLHSSILTVETFNWTLLNFQVLSDPRYGSNLSNVEASLKKHQAISADIMSRLGSWIFFLLDIPTLPVGHKLVSLRTELSFLPNCKFCARAGYVGVYKKCSLVKMNRR